MSRDWSCPAYAKLRIAGVAPDKEMKEPRFLVASERTVATRTLIRYYAKRWGIETSLRDIKDMRFGMERYAMRLPNPERIRDRLTRGIA